MVPPDVLAAPSARKRFLREIENASALRHPHSVEVLGHGETQDGGGYLVMERLFGTTLAARLREDGALPQLRAIKIAVQILEAVGAAHRLHIVHRDLKPSNVILIDRDGDPDFVKVCDFGLAKAIDPHELDLDESGIVVEYGSVTTQAGEICGTPEYMAPEQARGEPIDARADLYAIAVILFHAVVGQVPFSGRTTLSVVSQHLAAPPPRPRDLRPDLAIYPPLENLILRVLAKDRAERPSSAEVLRADLLQIERDYRRRLRSSPETSSVSSPMSSGTLPAATSTRSPGRPWLLALWGAALAILVVGGLWRSSARERQDTETVVRRPERSPPGSVAAVTPDRSTVPPALPAPAPPSAAPAALSIAPRLNAPPPPVSRAPRAEVRSADPTGAELLAQAEQRLSQGLVAEACALGDLAAARAPVMVAAYEFLGRCYMRLGEPERARANYRKYLALSPTGPNAVFIRAILDPEDR
jgi:serine/threonine-protein kinase